jgi:hypothetical protein
MELSTSGLLIIPLPHTNEQSRYLFSSHHGLDPCESRRQETAAVKGCRRARWQEPGDPGGSIILDSDEIHAIDEERRRTGIARAGCVEALQDDHADSESPDEAEYDEVEEDNGNADMEPSGGVNLYSDDRGFVDIQQETPQGIQDALHKLHGASLQSIPMGLTMEIARRSPFWPFGAIIP